MNDEQNQNPGLRQEFYRLPDVLRFAGFKSRSHLYVLAKTGKFPKPVKIGPNSIAWRRSELEAWANNLPVAEPGRRRESNRKSPPTNRGRKGNGHHSGTTEATV